MIYFICLFLFAAMYAIKGGSGVYVFTNWAYVRRKNSFFDRLLDGKVLSTIIAFGFALIATADYVAWDAAKGVPAYSLNIESAFLFAAAWLLTVAPSMGEEHGAIGTSQGGWGDYLKWMPREKTFKLFGIVWFDYTEGRIYGIKKGLQRGIWIGALMAAATGYLPYIGFSLLFVPCVFIGQELSYRILGRDGWVLSEPLIGAVVYGIPTAMLLT